MKIADFLKNLFRKKSPEEKFLNEYLNLVKKYKLQLVAYFQIFKNNQLLTDEKQIREVQKKINEFLNKNKLGLRADITIARINPNNGENIK